MSKENSVLSLISNGIRNLWKIMEITVLEKNSQIESRKWKEILKYLNRKHSVTIVRHWIDYTFSCQHNAATIKYYSYIHFFIVLHHFVLNMVANFSHVVVSDNTTNLVVGFSSGRHAASRQYAARQCAIWRLSLKTWR